MNTALMLPRVRSKQIHSAVPTLWRLWFEVRFEASPRLTRELWRQFTKRATSGQLFLLQQANRRTDGSGVPAFMAAVQPADVIDLIESLAPRRTARPKEIVLLEEKILTATSSTGVWL